MTSEARHSRFSVLVVVSIAAAILIGAAVFHQFRAESCRSSYRDDVRVKIGSNTLIAEKASRFVEQEKGLGGRPCIGENQGMLFEFDQPGEYGFWMKDMRFPIDIVWIGPDRKVVKIQSNVDPSTYPKIFSNKKPASRVLELKAGRAKALGLKIGSLMRLQS